MSWANAALNNLVSLDWGYDRETIARFKREAGIAMPAELLASGRDEVEMAPKRYDFIIKNYREKWIDWRCRQMVDLYIRLRDRVRAANSRFKLSISIFSVGPLSNGKPTATDLAEAGLDLSMLRELDGVTLINAIGSYGRRESARNLAAEITRLSDGRAEFLILCGKL